MFFPPLRRQFSREGRVQQGGFAGFVGVEDGLDFFPGGVELRKERFDARDEAALLGERGERHGIVFDEIQIDALLTDDALVGISRMTYKFF